MKKENTNKEHLLGKLPVHRPKAAVWQKIERDLEASSQNPVFPGLMKKMPLHTPPPNVWKSIEKSLNQDKPKILKIARGVATGVLLLLFILLVLNVEKWFYSGKDLISDNLPGEVQLSDTIAASTNPTADKPAITGANVLPESRINTLIAEKDDNSEIEGIIVSSNTDQEIENLESSISEKKEENTFSGKADEAQNFLFNPITPIEIPEKQLSFRAFPVTTPSTPEKREGRTSGQREFIYETGIFIQPFYAKNVSTISGELVSGRAAGISFAARNSRILLETGFIFSEIKFTSDFDLKYYSYQYLGPIVCLENFHEIQEVNEEGDTIITRQYYPEVIELYDSTFNETEKPDKVTISKIEIPFLLGTRLIENGKFFTDVKAGLEMAVISKRIFHVNIGLDQNTRLVAIETNQPETFTVKWKYNLALRIGYRLNEKISVFAEPFYAKYLDQMQKPDGSMYPKPEEAGIKFGISIEY